MKKSSKRIVRAAAAAVGASIGLALLTPVSASAAQADSCVLRAGPTGRDHMAVLFLTCPPKAAGDTLYKINLWGEDLASDDRIHTYTINCALPPTITMRIHENRLNEDIADRDEVYAGVWFKRPNGTTYGVRSNTVAGWWGAHNVLIPQPEGLC